MVFAIPREELARLFPIALRMARAKSAASWPASNTTRIAAWRGIPSASTVTTGSCCVRWSSGWRGAGDPPTGEKERRRAAALRLDRMVKLENFARKLLFEEPPLSRRAALSRAMSWACHFP